MANHILELKLNTECYQKHILDKRFNISEHIYNTVLKYAIKQLKRMRENKTYKQTLSHFINIKTQLDKSKNKEVNKELKLYSSLLNDIRNSYNLTEYGLHSYVKIQQHMYKKHIDSNTSQKIATTVWKSIEDVLFSTGKKVHFKKKGQLSSVEGKSNKAGIRFNKDTLTLHWNKLNIPVKLRANDLFIQESLELNQIKYCRIVRKYFKTGVKYFLQLIMSGNPPIKRINSTGAFRTISPPNERVGIDIGTSTIAVSSKDKLILTELAKKSNQYDKELNRLLRKLDRSKRSTNPNNFNIDGTIKRCIKLKWICSNNYMKILFNIKNLYRLKANYIKLSHNKLANEIVSLGNEVYVEKMNFRALQKRSKETTKNSKGKFHRKKRFGKSLNNKAPSMLLRIIDKKLKYIDKELITIKTNTFRASQYNHVTNEYVKKKLSNRWNKINNEYIQRDLYSAYLLMNSKSNLKETDRDLCIKGYNKFRKLHNKLIEQLKNNKEYTPRSMGIKKK